MYKVGDIVRVNRWTYEGEIGEVMLVERGSCKILFKSGKTFYKTYKSIDLVEYTKTELYKTLNARE